MLRNLVHYSLIVLVAFTAYIYLNDFIVYLGEPIYLDTVYGKVKGSVRNIRGGRKIYAFTSIPYAKPPVENLRFEPPVPYGNWGEEIFDATKKIRLCLQYDPLWKKIDGVEDCLQLHIYSPNVGKNQPLLPVMVWFHGGHFMFGGNDIYGPEYLLENGDVVLVAVNYRLNALGFLNTGDGVVTGNQGLKDQNLALQWIQKAIRDFGGDPNSVTLFGCSAGGASVSYHMISPMSKGLFHRAISQSGSSLCPWAFVRNPKNQSKRLAEKLNCSAEAAKSSSELVKCLRAKPAREIVSIHQEIGDIFHEVDAIFGPTIEKVEATAPSKGTTFLPDSPTKLYVSGKSHPVPWIVGVTSEEGCFRAPLIMAYEDKLSELNEKWSEILPRAMLLYNDDPKLSEKIKTFYFGNRKIPKHKDGGTMTSQIENEKSHLAQIGWNDLESITNMYSDRYFLGCVRDAAALHAQNAPTHLYYYTYKPDIGYGYIQEITRGRIPVQLEIILGYLKFMLYRHVLNWEMNDYGVCHTDEMQTLFQLNPLLTIDESSHHYDFSKKIVKLWTSFAKNGIPDDFHNVKWLPLQYSARNNQTVRPLQYLRLGKVPAMIEEPFTKRLEFWEDLNLPKN